MYLSIIVEISDAVPATTNSIFPKSLKATSVAKFEYVEGRSALKFTPDKALKYSSQVNWILSCAFEVELIPLIKSL